MRSVHQFCTIVSLINKPTNIKRFAFSRGVSEALPEGGTPLLFLQKSPKLTKYLLWNQPWLNSRYFLQFSRENVSLPRSFLQRFISASLQIQQASFVRLQNFHFKQRRLNKCYWLSITFYRNETVNEHHQQNMLTNYASYIIWLQCTSHFTFKYSLRAQKYVLFGDF